MGFVHKRLHAAFRGTCRVLCCITWVVYFAYRHGPVACTHSIAWGCVGAVSIDDMAHKAKLYAS